MVSMRVPGIDEDVETVSGGELDEGMVVYVLNCDICPDKPHHRTMLVRFSPEQFTRVPDGRIICEPVWLCAPEMPCGAGCVPLESADIGYVVRVVDPALEAERGAEQRRQRVKEEV